jgi:hypothetical protein
MNVRLISLGAMLIFLSCENPFNPFGEYTPRIVAYSVISNTGGSQFVRVSATYDPAGLDPSVPVSDTGVAGADVRIMTTGGTYVFRDTVIQTEGSETPINLYVCDSLPVVHGASYTMEVRFGSFEPATATAVIPGMPVVAFPRGTANALDGPGGPLLFPVGLSSHTRRHRVRMLIEFESPDSVVHRWEVPLSVNDTSFSFTSYPEFQYTESLGLEVKYPGGSYITTLDKIVYRYTTAVKFRNIVIEVVQIGALEDYSSIVNGFKDELSLRADEPELSNVSHGFGFFGAFTRDEILRPFPASFFWNPYPSH